MRDGLRPVGGDAGEGDPLIVEILDERDPLAESALEIIGSAFRRPDRQPLEEIRSEIAEKRLDLLTAMDFHLLAAVGEDGSALGTAAGLYFEGVNAGFITYLAVAPRHRGKRLAPRLRSALVELLREDGRQAGYGELAWVLGEVRTASPWLKRLVRARGALVFDVTYYHPGMTPGADGEPYSLYRQPVGDHRRELPAHTVRRALYAIYRRGYRVRYPLERPGFQAMLAELDGRSTVGVRDPGL